MGPHTFKRPAICGGHGPDSCCLLPLPLSHICRLLAWGEDTAGGEKFTLHVKDLATGKELLKKPIPDTAGNVAWASDNRTLFYVTKDKLDR